VVFLHPKLSFAICLFHLRSMVCRTPSIHLSLGLPLLRVPSGSHSTIFSGNVFPGIRSTCPNHRSRFSSVTFKMFFRTSMISLMVPFRTFSFLDFLADLLQKSINLFACCVFSDHVSAPYSKILWTKFLVLWKIVLLHKTEFISEQRGWWFVFSEYVLLNIHKAGYYLKK
jgi:hypothetical protein